MIQSISNRTFQTVKYFAILKFMILQQNISTVWIFGDQNSWHQYGIETNGVIQHLVGTLPKYIFNLNNGNKRLCADNENIINLNIFLVSQKFGSNEMSSTCPTDYTMLLVQNNATKIVLPQKYCNNTLTRLVLGTINSSTIDSMKTIDCLNIKPMENVFVKQSLNMNSSDFRIFFNLRPPDSMFTLMNKKYIFFGPDSHVAKEISKMLNATAVFQTNVGLEYPSFQLWFSNESSYAKNAKILRTRKSIITTNVITDFYQK